MRLSEILGSAVVPVIDALLHEDDVQGIWIHDRQDRDSGTELRIVVEGETFLFYVETPGQAPESIADLRHRLAEDLQDFVSESSFGWGQLRPHDF